MQRRIGRGMGPAAQAASTRQSIRLSEGAPESTASERPATATTEPLGAERVEQILQRLEPLAPDAAEQRQFAFPPQPVPPPKTGRTLVDAFPPVQGPAPPAATAKPLAVLQFGPEGDVATATQLSVTFSEPMVAVTSVDQLKAADVPVKLSPQPPGQWRWVGTKTLLFVPEQRFAMATRYTASVPTGTKCAAGTALAAAHSWQFVTPAVQLIASYPNHAATPTEPVMFAAFDQKIDPQAVLEKLAVWAGDRAKKYSLRMASQAEIDADATVSRLVQQTLPGRWLAFRAAEPFPTGSGVTAEFAVGTPSAEGPLTTDRPLTFAFNTYSALAVSYQSCRPNDRCTPGTPLVIGFNNPLDEESLDGAVVRVEPELPGLRAEINGNSLNIWGRTAGRTVYKATISANLRDTFGQTLGKDQTLTFHIGSAYPNLYSSAGEVVVADPLGPPRFSVYSTTYKKLRVRLYTVRPEDYDAYRTYLTDGRRNDPRKDNLPPPGRLAFDEQLAVAGPVDQVNETAIDLTKALTDGLGHVIVLVEPSPPPGKDEPYPVLRHWVQRTKLGLTALWDGTDLTAWVNSLADGKPADGVKLRLWPSTDEAVSDASGTAQFVLPTELPQGSGLLLAQRGNDVALLPKDQYGWGPGSGWQRAAPYDSWRWFVFDDRQMYRPGELVHIKGWLRKITAGKSGDVTALGGGSKTVRYQLNDSQGNEVLKGEAAIGDLGSFDLQLELPKGMNLGHAQLAMTADKAADAGVVGGETHFHNVQVQEFRRPEFEVATSASAGPHLVRDHATVSVTASYFAGGPLPAADVQWSVNTSAGHFSPPGWQEFTFGAWTPWWFGGLLDGLGQSFPGGRGGFHNGGGYQSFAGKTDAAGRHHLKIDFDEISPPHAMNVTASAGVMDVNRQMWHSATTLLVHPAAVYVGLKPVRTFVEQGEPLEVDAIVPDLDGKPSVGRTIRLRVARIEWTHRQGRWQETEVDEQELEHKSAAEPVRFSIPTGEGGSYRLVATVLDDLERENETTMTLYVSGGKLPPQRDVRAQHVELIPSGREFAASDTAEILVRAPFAPAEGIVTVSRSGVLSSERITLMGATHTLRVPIVEQHVPNVYVRVDLVGAAPRTDDAGKEQANLPPRPAFAVGELNLSVPPRKRTLQVTAAPRETATSPGTETDVTVTVLDAEGQPAAGAEVALVVVDEAILSLTGYRLPSPLDVFYGLRESGLMTRHLREHVVLARPEDALAMQQEAQGVGGAAAEFAGQAPMKSVMRRSMALDSAMPASAPALAKNGGGETAGPIAVRSDFNPVAAFVPALRTDSAGKATASLKLPDNLTRYRVMAVAVHGDNHFGSGEAALTARLPLMVRPSPPRFLNFGDTFELPVVLQNQTDAVTTADVALRAVNLRLGADGANSSAATGLRVIVPANDRVEVRFPAAAHMPGTARFQVAAVAGSAADAASLALPVWTPATTEAFATYGQLDDESAAIQPVQMPADVIREFGGLELSTSSTALAALTDAVIYLADYPFGCAEQISSRVLALAALKDVLSAFQAEQLPAPEQLAAAVERDLKELQKMQNPDGGFGFWRQGERSWPYLGIHVAHAMARARQKDFAVPEEMLERSKNYLRNIEQMIPADYPESCRSALQAYAYYVLERLGEEAHPQALTLLRQNELKDLSLDTLGWLLAVLADAPDEAPRKAIRQYLGNRATQTASTAQFATGHAEGTSYLILHSDRRTDAIILDALIADDPQHPLIPKLVTGLLAHRKRGHWTNTQENVFVLLALDRYFQKYESQTPDFVARAWLGPQYAAEHAYRGRSTDQHLVNVPMDQLGEPGTVTDLTLAKQGKGRLYYRLGLRYAPSDLNLPAADYGFHVERAYSAVERPEDVRRDSDGTWRIRAGAKVRVQLTMVASERRYHVALVDPLPAGLEATNPALAVSGEAAPTGTVTMRGGPWWWRWFEHQNMRDQRIEAFASLVYGGVYTYSYEARATTPGYFVAPPTKAEEMYAPETFGRGATDRVIVEIAP